MQLRLTLADWRLSRLSTGCQVDRKVAASLARPSSASGLSGRWLDQFDMRNALHRNLPDASNEVFRQSKRSVSISFNLNKTTCKHFDFMVWYFYCWQCSVVFTATRRSRPCSTIIRIRYAPIRLWRCWLQATTPRDRFPIEFRVPLNLISSSSRLQWQFMTNLQLAI